MKINIRQEVLDDHKHVFDVIAKAFAQEEMSDHREQYLVQRLRQSDAFIPELSLVAEIDGHIVGHILLTKIKINNDSKSYDSLALAPVSVLPLHQRKGIGGMLITYAHEKARELGHGSIVLLGHAGYYPRFGYVQADRYDINLPFEVPTENCMAIELSVGALSEVSGTVEYPPAFLE